MDDLYASTGDVNIQKMNIEGGDRGTLIPIKEGQGDVSTRKMDVQVHSGCNIVANP